jgi:hypothetical protein
MDANEAHDVLVSTATKAKLISWFDPFWDQMRTAIERKKNSVILGGRDFNIRHHTDRAGNLYHVFMVTDNFIPMIAIHDHDLKTRTSVENAITAG